MTLYEMERLLELAESFNQRERQLRNKASTRLNPVEAARLAGKAAAYSHAAELLREVLDAE